MAPIGAGCEPGCGEPVEVHVRSVDGLMGLAEVGEQMRVAPLVSSRRESQWISVTDQRFDPNGRDV